MSGPRGTGRLQLDDGSEVNVLFTNRALAEAEKITDKPVLKLAGSARDGALGMNDVAGLLMVGMEFARRDAGSGGERVTMKDAWNVLDKAGFVPCAVLVTSALADVLSYGADGNGVDPTRMARNPG